MYNNKAHLNSYRGVLKNKNLSKVIDEALLSPVGSTKRKQAMKMISVIRKTKHDGQGGPGPAIPRVNMRLKPVQYDYSNFLILPSTPPVRVPFGEKAPTPKPVHDGAGFVPLLAGAAAAAPYVAAGAGLAARYGGTAMRAMGAGLSAMKAAPALSTAGGRAATALNTTLVGGAGLAALGAGQGNTPAPVSTPKTNITGLPQYGSPALNALTGKTGPKTPEQFAASLKSGGTQPNQPGTPTQGPSEALRNMSIANSPGGQNPTQGNTAPGIVDRFANVQSAVDNNMGATMFAVDAMNRGGDYLKSLPGFENLPSSMLNGGGTLSGRLQTIDNALRKSYSLDEMLNSYTDLVRNGIGLEGRLTDYVRGRDEFLNETEDMITDLKKRTMKMDMSDPRTQASVGQHMNYLYEMRGRQNKRYVEFLDMSVKEADNRVTAAEQLYQTQYDNYAREFEYKSNITKEEYQMMYTGLTELYTNVAEAPARAWEAAKSEQEWNKTQLQIMKDQQELSGFTTGSYPETYKMLQDVNVIDGDGRWKINNHAISIAGQDTYSLLKIMDDGVRNALSVPDKDGNFLQPGQAQQVVGNALGHLLLMKTGGYIDEATYNSYHQNILNTATTSLASDTRGLIGDDKLASYKDAVKSIGGTRGWTFWNKTKPTRAEFLKQWSGQLDSGILNSIYTDMEGFTSPQEYIDTFMTGAGELGQGGAEVDDNTIRTRLVESYVRKLQPQAISGSMGFNPVGGGTNQASRIASAIKKVESNGNYNARGASGEFGAYQFMPSTWTDWAGAYLGNPNAPMTQQNQDQVAMAKISELIKQGYNEQQIALIWNGGSPNVKKGVNSYGVAYDSGAYANKVMNALQYS